MENKKLKNMNFFHYNKMIDNILEFVIPSVLTFLGIIITSLNNKRKNSNAELELNARIQQLNTLPELTEHVIFTNMTEYLRRSSYIDVRHVCEGRKILGIDFLKTAISDWEEPCNKFAKEMTECHKNCKLNCTSCTKIYTHAMHLFEEGVDYSLKDIPSEDREAYEIFASKFNQWNLERSERLQAKIKDVCLNGSVYKTCELKSSRILEAIDDYIFDMITDATLTIMKLNGELGGKKYKGRTL